MNIRLGFDKMIGQPGVHTCECGTATDSFIQIKDLSKGCVDI